MRLIELDIPQDIKMEIQRQAGGESIYIPARVIPRDLIRKEIESGKKPLDIARSLGVGKDLVYRIRREQS